MICKFQHDGMCCNCGSLHYQRVCMERNCPHIAPISNADHIRSMTDEELGDFLDSIYCHGWNYGAADRMDDDPDYHEWLKQPYKEDT